MHDIPTLAAIGAIAGLTGMAIVTGTPDGALAGAIAALATLGGVKLALKK